MSDILKAIKLNKGNPYRKFEVKKVCGWKFTYLTKLTYDAVINSFIETSSKRLYF